MKEIPIIQTKWGLASRVGNKIYISQDIDKYSVLYFKLLEHELEHSDGYKLHDVLMDLKGKHLRDVKKEYYKFLFTHPRTWVMFLPIWKYDNDWTIDITLLIVWLITVFIIGAVLI